jgi:hypothetical protein
MHKMKYLSFCLAGALLVSGCSTTHQAPDGSSGPQLSRSYEFDSRTQYVQVGVEFSTWGDFVALVSPSRWSSPFTPGGSLSWVNPAAWRHDWARTGRIFLGEAAVIGVAAAAAGGGGGGDTGGSSGPTVPGGGGTGTPPPPPPPPVGP